MMLQIEDIKLFKYIYFIVFQPNKYKVNMYPIYKRIWVT